MNNSHNHYPQTTTRPLNSYLTHHSLLSFSKSSSSSSKDCSMNVIVYKNNHQNGFRAFNDELHQTNLLQPQPTYQQTLMHRSATQNHLSSKDNQTNSTSPNWPNKTANWLSTSGRLSSMSFYSMLSSSLSNLSINAFNYKLEFANFQLLKVEPAELANQITIYDVQLFRNIKQEEILGFGWKTPRKAILAPNITAYTRRFNQISFWTINEILLANFKHNPQLKNSHLTARSLITLNETDSIKCRTAVLAHFIKIAKKLYLLNNIQSCYAIISALNSSSIYRLTKTWNQISKKDKKSFDEMSRLFSEENNFENLRLHLKTIKGNCVPYLGMYFKDLIYIDTAYPHPKDKKNNNTVNFQRDMKIRETVQQILDSLTTSHYDNLVVNETIRTYLQSINYVEELQKFMEEDYYKLSLKLEPVESKQLSKSNKNLYDNKTSINQSTFYVSQNDVNDFNKPTRTSLNSSFQFNPVNCSSNTTTPNSKFKNNSNSFTFEQQPSHQSIKSQQHVTRNFVPSHRKSLSLGANVILPNRVHHTPLTNKQPTEVINYENRYLIDDTLLEETSDLHSLYKEELKFNKIPSLNSLNSQQTQSNGRLMDDSSCEQPSISTSIPNHSSTSNQTSLNSESNHQTSTFENSAANDTDRTDIELDNESDSNSLLPKSLLNIKYQGYLKRKTVLKEGRKPTLPNWCRYWVILNSTSLIFYSSKSLRGCSRSHFKSTPTKCISLRSSLITVKLDEETCMMDTFILSTDENDKTVYKFKTNTQLEAITWCREINQTLHQVLSNNPF